MSLPTQYIVTEGYKYTLAVSQYIALRNFREEEIVTEHFRLRKNVLEIKKGYAWDGASGPTWDTKDTITPSLVHDVLYQAIRIGHLAKGKRFDADLEFYQLMRSRTHTFFGHLRAFYFFLGVRMFGWMSIRPKKQGEEMDHVFVAP